jgi:hypothetical protein
VGETKRRNKQAMRARLIEKVESFLDEPGCDDAGKGVLYVIACRGHRIQVYIVRNKRDLTVCLAIQEGVGRG